MKHTLASLMHATPNEVDAMFRQGRISNAVHRAYTRVWTWSAPRWGGIACELQEAFHAQHGWKAYQRRIDKVRAAFGFKPLYQS